MTRLAGRDRELARIRSLLAEASRGAPRALVVHGEAGVGKTRLVREALHGLDLTVAWGTCVHFGASTLPFAPLVSALRPWLDTGGEQDEVAHLIPVVDRTLRRLAAERPAVLVVDDLQWADVSSLDALAFAIAGFADQRLAVLATCRDEERPAGSVMHGWLADVRRMPGFEEMHLGRLEPAGTEELVAGHLGRPVDLGLVAEVQERSGGNAYLAELLVRDLPPGSRRLPEGAPAVLAQALTARWHGLSPTARTVVQVLAVGGRPRDRGLLARVAAAHGVSGADVEEALEEAADKGVVEAAQPVWFRHPLLAEVLEAAAPPAFAARVHATYAAFLEEQHDVPERRRADDVAVHHLRAGHAEAAFRWSVKAADAAAEAHAASEVVHLERACALWDELPAPSRSDVRTHVDLLRRTARVAERLGRLDNAIALVEQARALVSAVDDPRLSSSLLTHWCQLLWQRDAPTRAVRPELFEAVRLVEAFPDSVERVAALTDLAGAFLWDGAREEGRRWAAQALESARRSGSDAALADAMTMMARALDDDPETAMRHGQEAQRIARDLGDADLVTDAAIWLVNQLIALDRPRDALDLARVSSQDGLELGSVAWSWFLAGMAASLALELGEWDESRRLVRAALAARPVAIPGALAHLVAAQQAVLLGEVGEGRAHLDRALELVPEYFVGLRYDLTRSHLWVLTAEGTPERAFDWLVAQHRHSSPVDQPGDLLDFLALAARAAADMAEAARDHRDLVAAASAESRLEALVADVGAAARPAVPSRTAIHAEALLEAERARCHRSADEEQRWGAAAAAAEGALCCWEQAYALWRQAAAAARAGSPRARVSNPLRGAHRIASRLGARPLVEDLERLATAARVSLEAVDEPPPRLDPDDDLPTGLTAREREVLAHLVAGHSNGQIARELVISEKTVSVHVSNILRKTGTASRVEAAALAGRLG